MRLCKIAFSAITISFCWAVTACVDEAKATTLFFPSVGQRIENTVNFLYSKDAIPKDILCNVLRNLNEVKEMIEAVKERFHGQDDFLSILHMVIKQKLALLQQDGGDMERTLRHLLQLAKGLRVLQLKQKDVDQIYPVTFAASSNLTSESQITEFLVEAMNTESSCVSITNDRGLNPDLKKLLKTGSFVLLMLGTTADVCVFTGWGPCIVLYVVGSGGLVVWFAQILEEIFGAENVSIFERTVER